jgi:6-bladed beta-propeller
MLNSSIVSFAVVSVALMAPVVSPVRHALQDTVPDYPRISLATWYEVDATWPEKPGNIQWGHVPGIAVDAKDQVWVYTRAIPPVQIYTSEGKFVRSWGEDQIKTAHHMKFDQHGNVWLADIGYHVVMQFTPDGKLLKTLGTKGQAGCDETHLDQPTDMAITPEGDVFVSDGYGNNRIVHFDASGKFVNSWGKLGTGPGEFSLPHAIAIDSNRHLYVADRNNVRVQVFDTAGKFLSEWRDIITPWGFWLTKLDEIWVCGSSPMPWRKTDEALGCPPKDQLFMKFNATGKLLQLWTVPKATDGDEHPGECNWVHCVAFDSKGNLYAGDIIGKRAQKFLRREKVGAK